MRLLSIIFFVFLSMTVISCSRNSTRKELKTEKKQIQSKQADSTVKSPRVTNSDNTIRIRKKGGVYFVPIQINGVDMEFIFDTGASDIVMSSVEAAFLVKQGKLTEQDIIGQASYQIADGSISTGTVINLKTVKIGNKTLYNVKASIVENINAPLLLGQSALSQFGKINIDYQNNQIIFED